MKLKRREFLAALAAPVVGRVFPTGENAPRVLKLKPRSPGVTTLAELQRAYNQCWFGKEAPTAIWIGSDAAV